MSTIAVPRWALEFILEYGCFQDQGPSPEGWSSPEMGKALNAINEVLAVDRTKPASRAAYMREHRKKERALIRKAKVTVTT